MDVIYLLTDPSIVAAFLVGAPLVLMGMFTRRRRQVVTGLLLAVVALLAVVMARGGTIPRGRSYLILVHAGTEGGGAKRLVQQLQGKDAPLVGFARLSPTPHIDTAKKTHWGRPEDSSIKSDVTIGGDRWLVKAAEAARPGWWDWAKAFFPRPTVLVPFDGDDIWRVPNIAAGAGVASPNDVADAVFDAGADVLVVDVTDSGRSLGAGRLTLSLSNTRIGGGSSNGTLIPLWMTDRVDVHLQGCPYTATSGYSIRAWIDRRGSVSTSAAQGLLAFPSYSSEFPLIVVPGTAAADENPQHGTIRVVGQSARTTLALNKFTPSDANLKAGHHRLDVELSFDTVIDGVTVPLRFHAVQYFEVADTTLVLLDNPTGGWVTRHSWVHRPRSVQVRPPDARDALHHLLNLTEYRGRRANSRLPFARTAMFDLSKYATTADFTAAAEARILNASAVMLVAPSWDEVRRVDPVLRKYIGEKGGTIVTVAPPVPLPTDPDVPPWLPAVGAHDTTAPPGSSATAIDEYSEPRLYFLLDSSRPASKFPAAGELGVGKIKYAIGGELQSEIVNYLYSELKVIDRAGNTISKALLPPATGTSDFTVLPDATSIGLTIIGVGDAERVGLVVPPFLTRLDTTAETIAGSNYTTSRDAASSWIATRLWTLAAGPRSDYYQTIQKGLAAPEASAANPLPVGVFDAPLQMGNTYPGAVVVAFALDVRQPKEGSIDWTAQGWKGSAWTTTSARDVQLSQAPAVDPAALVRTGAQVLIVPIKISAGLTTTYNSVLPAANSWTLQEAASHWGAAIVTDAAGQSLSIDLSGDNQSARDSAKAVKIRVAELVKTRFATENGKMKVKDGGRAIDSRVTSEVVAPRVWRKMRVVEQDGITVPSAAVIARAGVDDAPAVVWRPLGRGSVVALAYSPVANDVWHRDAGPSLALNRDLDPHRDAMLPPEGWGLQRLCDPISLAAGAPAKVLTIDTITESRDGTSLIMEVSLPKLDLPMDLPSLEPLANVPGAVRPQVEIAGIDAAGSSLTLALSLPAGSPAIAEDFNLTWGSNIAAGPVYVRLRASDDPIRNTRNALGAVAELTGGLAIPEHLFKGASGARWSLTWIASTALLFFVALALTPLSRRWPVLLLLRRRSQQDFVEAAAQDSVAMEAAFDASGTNLGTPAAQRPAGRLLQIRPMRPGDSPLAARRSDWAYFVPEIAAMLGSPLLPRVLETPRLEALSILTLLDWHPGAGVSDIGSFEDRRAAMARVATLNALVAARRGGLHHVMSLQMHQPRDAIEPAPPDYVAPSVNRLTLGTGRDSARVLPELLPGEAIVVVTNAAANIDSTLSLLARRCIEERCLLAVVLLTHPLQTREVGLMRRPGHTAAFRLLDRNDTDPSEIVAYMQRRAEAISAQVDVAEGRVCELRTDQPHAEVVALMMEALWEMS